MDMEQALQTYFAESRGLLHEMEDALLGLERDPGDAELIGALFRAAHTIKGSAGMFGLDAVVGFTHVVENLLDQVRAGEARITPDLVGILLECADHIGALIDQAAGRADLAAGALEADGARLLQALRAWSDDDGATLACLPEQPDAPLRSEGGSMMELDNWHISVQFGADVIRNGMDPASLIRYLGSIGQIVSLRLSCPDMPDIGAMDPQACYLAFEIGFRSDADKAAIEDVFAFVRDDCRLRILPPPSSLGAFMARIETLKGNMEMLGEILLEAGILTDKELSDALEMQSAGAAGSGPHAQDRPPLGQILVSEGLVPPAALHVALEKQKEIREHKNEESKFIRVSAEKLDQLIDLVGELIIAGASASLLARRAGNEALFEANSVINRFVEEIREDALRLRMVEIGETFHRFQRVVRDVSKDIGKDIGLHISGAETELDKTVVEKIGDPLTHLVRNAMDHGIEPGALRSARGKPARGTVTLNACHDSGSIVIEVRDDGGGLNRERILAKAIERGLVAAGAALSDREIYNLIFEAGFSTAETVTKLSGRGVGMDVVKRNIHALRGTVDVDSCEGVGTTVRIRLPLTLAIIDGFLVGVGNTSFVIPLDMVLECLELSDAQHQATHERDYINLRGEVLPLINLRTTFKIGGESGRRRNVVVVKYAGKKAGLVVCTLLGEFQTVIKPLNKMFSQVRCISGSTILGSGDVALILDVPTLIEQAAQAAPATPRSAAALN